VIVGPVPAEAGNVVDMTDMTAASELNESTDPAGSHDVSPDVSREVQPVAGSANDPLAELESDLAAVDAALECWRKGASVSMVLLGDEVDDNVKYWARPDIMNRIKEGSIQAYTRSRVKQILPQEVILSTPTGEVQVPNDWVLALTGYKPNFSLLDQLGVQLSLDEKRQPCYDQANQESNVPGVYLAGVVCGGLNTREFFIENSISHAEAIIQDILKK
jgi:thioredoxin reductase (NADPH)